MYRLVNLSHNEQKPVCVCVCARFISHVSLQRYTPNLNRNSTSRLEPNTQVVSETHTHWVDQDAEYITTDKHQGAVDNTKTLVTLSDRDSRRTFLPQFTVLS